MKDERAKQTGEQDREDNFDRDSGILKEMGTVPRSSRRSGLVVGESCQCKAGALSASGLCLRCYGSVS